MIETKTLPTEYVTHPGAIRSSVVILLRTDEMIINMGPQHPSTHGVLRLEIVVDGEIIVDVIPHIGYLHRCFEKHCEHMTNYQQVIPYCDRLDYCRGDQRGAFGTFSLCESLLKIEVPGARGIHTRDHGRASAYRQPPDRRRDIRYGCRRVHAVPLLHFMTGNTFSDMFEMTCGARLLYNYIWIGGLSHDIPPQFVDKAKEFCTYFKPRDQRVQRPPYLQRDIHQTDSQRRRAPEGCRNQLRLQRTDAPGFGRQLGSPARRSLFRVSQARVGAESWQRVRWGQWAMCWDRHIVRMREMEESVKIIEQALAELPGGERAGSDTEEDPPGCRRNLRSD